LSNKKHDQPFSGDVRRAAAARKPCAHRGRLDAGKSAGRGKLPSVFKHNVGTLR